MCPGCTDAIAARPWPRLSHGNQRRRRIVVDQHMIERRIEQQLPVEINGIGIGDHDARGEGHARHRILQLVDPEPRTSGEDFRDRHFGKPRHLLNRPIEDEITEAERACERAIVGLERGRETAQRGRKSRLTRRDQAVVITNAQRVIAVGQFPSAHHGEILPTPRRRP